jgi:hypothetical protein
MRALTRAQENCKQNWTEYFTALLLNGFAAEEHVNLTCHLRIAQVYDRKPVPDSFGHLRLSHIIFRLAGPAARA